MKRNIFFLIISFLFICIINYGQIKYGGIPYSLKTQQPNKINIPIIDMPEINRDLLKSHEKENHFKSKAFTEVFDVEINPENAGIWTKLDDEIKVWQVGVRSKGAYSILLNFMPFNLPEGTELFIYNENYTHVLGSYTHKNNRVSNVFPIEPLQGEIAYIELKIHTDAISELKLNINRVGHDYLNFFKFLNNDDSPKSGDCEFDVNCLEDEEWQVIKNATFLYVYYHHIEKRHKYCNGTFVNNTRQNSYPYFITAGHCIWDQESAESVVAYFDYDSYYCNGPFKENTKTISGSDFVANVNRLDFGLAQFPEMPPYNYKPIMAGWNLSNDIPENVICIHHPLGDVKKASVDVDELEIASFTDEYDDNSFWKVKKWDIGTTEGGSSGGPLYDINKRIIGTLTGGDATCANPVNDYYTRFSFAWDKYSENDEQLKHWLDPDNINVSYIDGFDPYKIFKDSCDTTSNISNNTTIYVNETNSGWGYWTGHNSENITKYAQKFEINDSKELSGIFLNVAIAKSISLNSSVKITIWESNNNLPGDIIKEKEVSIEIFKENDYNYFEFDEIISLSDDFYVGYEINYQIPSDTFALFQSNITTLNSLNFYVFNNNSWNRIDEYSSNLIKGSLDIETILCDSMPLNIEIPGKTNQIDFKLYPVPANNYLLIDFGEKKIGVSTTIELLDITGRNLIATFEPYAFNQYQLNVNEYPAGIYIISVRSKTKHRVQKFIIH